MIIPFVYRILVSLCPCGYPHQWKSGIKIKKNLTFPEMIIPFEYRILVSLCPCGYPHQRKSGIMGKKS